jgi:hypothetical protein
MGFCSETDLWGRKIFLAGERVLPGIYRQIEGDREIRLDREDYLPASLDGQVAYYVRTDPVRYLDHRHSHEPVAGKP